MRQIQLEKIRNVVLVGHSGTGKTSLAEALLFEAGALGRLGRVDDGTTAFDSSAAEHRHRMSVTMAFAQVAWKGHKINLIDTPGFADFEYQAETAMSIADLAIFVVSAVDGVQVQHERLWEIAVASDLPRMIFINKLDRENASFSMTLTAINDRFGVGIAPLELPIGEESAFHGLADLLTDTAHIYDNGTSIVDAIPDELEDLEHRVHENLVEGIVVADDDLLERFLEGETPTLEQLETILAKGVGEASVFPVVCGSATERIGVDRLLDFICEIGPSPLNRPRHVTRDAKTESPLLPDLEGDPVAVVFNTTSDPYVGQISLVRVISGSIRTNDHLINSRTGDVQRLHSLFVPTGNGHHDLTEVHAGDLVAVAKLSSTMTGDTLCTKADHIEVKTPKPPEPIIAIAIAARTPADEEKLANALHRLTAQDRTLKVEHAEATRQTLLWGTGETHLSIAVEDLETRFGVSVEIDPVRVAYMETITTSATAEGRFKKQSGGHGQFGIVEIAIQPLPRGDGFEFVDKIVGGAIPRQYIPAIEKGIGEAMAEGGVFGFPVVDIRVECIDGKFHSVDSSEASFKMAGRLAIKAALAQAEPVILEPISAVEITVPSEYQGDVIGDLNSRRAQIRGTEILDSGRHVVFALVPHAEILRYATELRSRTSGYGQFTSRHDHYDVLPSHMVDAVMNQPDKSR